MANDLCDTKEIEVYTTRADTLLGVDYLVLSYEHPIMKQVVAENKNPTSELLDFVKQMSCTSVSEIDIGKAEKQGVFTGIYVTHPITNKKIPVWSANFVLMNYGTGAVMSVPAHDQRDYEFAKKYNLPISQVISPKDDLKIDLSKGAFEEKGVLINSGKYDGQTSKKAIKSIAFDLEKNGKGKITTNYRLRDWSVSRQRYWGSPIPMVYCEDCGIVAEKIENLPVKLPTEVELDGSGSPLSKMEGFANTPCPKCNKPAKRETDTFDTFFESSWYYINFACKDKSKLIDKQAQNLLPVDQYVGGVEHAILHLLYARFLFKVICDLNNIKKGSNEPFKKLLTQGMVLAETYFIKRDGKYQWFNPENVEVIKDKNGKIISAKTIDEGLEVEFGGINKMSKSKNNGIDPQDMIDSYGADSVRMFIMFAAPPEQTLEWSQDGVEGCFRFLKKFNGIVHKFLEENDVGSIKTPEQDKLPEELKKIRTKLHKGIAKIIDDLDRRYKFNTGIAQIMEIANTLQGIKGKSSDNIAVSKEIIESLILLLSPIAPHICHDLWAKFSDSDLITHPFPKVDSCALIESSIIMAVQINGKLRAKIQVSPDMKKEDIEKLALEQNGVIKFIGDSRIKKMIVVPNKIVNIVI
jgi:leucyl-tRNA synthetase